MPSITMDVINHSLDLMIQKYNYFLNTKIFFTLNFELRLLAVELRTKNRLIDSLTQQLSVSVTQRRKDSKTQRLRVSPRLCDFVTL
jgi:hypothetical protein